MRSDNEPNKNGHMTRGNVLCEITEDVLSSNPRIPITSSSIHPPPYSRRSAAMERFEMEQVFQCIDGNKDGKISVDDLGEMMELLGEVISKEEARDMLKEADTNGDGYIDLQEFYDVNTLAMNKLITKEIEEDEGIRAAFIFFDKNRDGFISKEELHTMLSKLDIMCGAIGMKERLKGGMTIEDCERMIHEFDLNGDGYVDFEEFKVMMTMNPNCIQAH